MSLLLLCVLCPQRLRDLKQYESGRRFGGHRNPEEEREKMRAAQQVAIERAQMSARRYVVVN